MKQFFVIVHWIDVMQFSEKPNKFYFIIKAENRHEMTKIAKEELLKRVVNDARRKEHVIMTLCKPGRKYPNVDWIEI